MDIIALVAIFLKLTLNNAKKPWLNVCVSGKRKTMMWWQHMIRWFEISRAEPLMPWFFFLLFICYNMLTRVIQFSWQAKRVSTSKTWVRTPGLYYAHIIFPFIFLCRHNLKAHHASSIIKHTRVQEIQIKGSRLMSTLHPQSTPCM